MAATVILLTMVSGCTRNVARVAGEWMPGPVRVDPDRPITIDRIDDDSVTVGLPLLADVAGTAGGGNTYVGPCTVRAAELLGPARDSVLALIDGGGPGILSTTQFASVRASAVEFDAGGLRSERVYFVGLVPRDPDPPQVAADDRSLLLELWSDPSSDVANNCVAPARSPAAEPSSLYLIDFELARPLTASVMGGGAYLIAAVGLTTLVALLWGGG